jgi:hypothetical protein
MEKSKETKMSVFNNEFKKEKKYITMSYKNITRKIFVEDDVSDEEIKIIMDTFEINADCIFFDIDSIEWVYCLVGNIIDKHEFGENKEIRYGTKHFAPGTKVYCYPGMYSNDERVYVVGKPRKTFKLIKVIMPTKYITNFRLKRIYDKRIIKDMILDGGWHSFSNPEERIIKLAKSLNVEINNIQEENDIEK